MGTAPGHRHDEAVEILYRDASLIAINKPSGMLTHPGWARAERTALTEARSLAGKWVYPAHRLDRATSGVLLFALDSQTASRVGRQFADGMVRKTYLALVRGIPPDAGVIDHAIPRKEGGERVQAITAFRRLATFERYALVEARPETGRLHQVRRHLKHISHPIIGDTTYGKGSHNRIFRQRFALCRLALHALRLELDHPDDGTPLVLEARIPDDLAVPFEKLGFTSVLQGCAGTPALGAPRP